MQVGSRLKQCGDGAIGALPVCIQLHLSSLEPQAHAGASRPAALPLPRRPQLPF